MLCYIIEYSYAIEVNCSFKCIRKRLVEDDYSVRNVILSIIKPLTCEQMILSRILQRKVYKLTLSYRLTRALFV